MELFIVLASFLAGFFIATIILLSKLKEMKEKGIKKSREVIEGKVLENLFPFLKGFPFSPSDVRFIGSPIDMVVFEGLSKGKVEKIYFVEVKRNKTAQLSEREKQIKNVVKRKDVYWYEYKGLRK